VANGRIIAADLIDRAWGELGDDEREVFDDWLRTASGVDLYLLLRYVRRRRPRTSSVSDLLAVRGDDGDDG